MTEILIDRIAPEGMYRLIGIDYSYNEDWYFNDFYNIETALNITFHDKNLNYFIYDDKGILIKEINNESI